MEKTLHLLGAHAQRATNNGQITLTQIQRPHCFLLNIKIFKIKTTHGTSKVLIVIMLKIKTFSNNYLYEQNFSKGVTLDTKKSTSYGKKFCTVQQSVHLQT